MAIPEPKPGPLDGLKVVDMTTSYAGPTASMYLADLGATVTKVERPGAGDDARQWGPPFVEGESAWFASANRNKRSVVLNLRDTAGVGVLNELIGQSDVFIQNLNPSKLERLGVDAETLTAKFPRLIYCAMSGFGQSGPDSSLPGYDLIAQARSGLMSVTGALDGSPQRVSTALSDIATGMCAALAISSAAVRQVQSGAGDVIDVSLMDTDLALMAPRIAAYLSDGEEPRPSGGTDSVLSIYQSFQTADRDIVVAIGNDAMWIRFCEAIGVPHLAENGDFAGNAGRRQHRQHLTEVIQSSLKTRTAAEWLSVMAECAVPATDVRGLSEVVADPHLKARGSFLPVPGVPGLHSVRSPFRMASIPEARNEVFPALGADTEAVLAELGYGADAVAALSASGAVQSAARVQEEILR